MVGRIDIGVRNDRALKDAHWDGVLSHEEAAMIREYRASGRKGVEISRLV
ncbi:hypothetical protein HWX16_16500 [Ochrobactrum intermedium]|nr:hypothetical protein [Brucella intermedia]NVM41929.1 hypothetical protein [Brucella intermedia]